MATWAMDINTDSRCSRITDPDMALGSSLDLDITVAMTTQARVTDPDIAPSNSPDNTMVQVPAQTTQISMALAAA